MVDSVFAMKCENTSQKWNGETSKWRRNDDLNEIWQMKKQGAPKYELWTLPHSNGLLFD